MRAFRIHRGWGWRLAATLLLFSSSMTALWPRGADAHAFLERSDPAANAVIDQAPTAAFLRFTEPIEPDFSKVELFDARGQKVETPASQMSADNPNEMVLRLPVGLPNGTYTLQWRNVSKADGHPESGYVPFTIGSQSDVVVPVAPEVTNFDKAPAWVEATGRWLGLLGVTGAVGALLGWLWVIQPSTRRVGDERYERIQDHVYRLALISLAVALLGSLIALIVQASNAGPLSASLVWDVLTNTRYGGYWLARIGLLAVLAIVFTTPALYDEPPARWVVALGLAAAAGALAPFALISHAAAQSVGRPSAVVADWLHLAGASVWVGALLAVLVGLIYGTRGAPGKERRPLYAAAVTRFSTLAIASVLVLSASGF